MVLTDQLIGSSAFYKVDSKGHLIAANKEVLEGQHKNYEIEIDEKNHRTNETMYVSELTQRLTEEEIKIITAGEKDPEKIIDLLSKNNANFEKRTEFSKQKYIDKKNKKYNLIIKIEPCALHNLNEYFVNIGRGYVFPRVDYLAYVLNHIHPEENENLFIAEKARGILLAGLLIKIADYPDSKVVLYHPKLETPDISKYEALKFMDIASVHKEKVTFVNKTSIKTIDSKLHYIIFACDEGEIEALQGLQDKLAFNSMIILFTNYYETATKIYEYLIEKKHFVNLLMHDYMNREIQAWPMRSHPMMSGNTCSGYIVTAINVNTNEK